jgi:hypothetical protein
MTLKKEIHTLQEKVFDVVVLITYVLYFIIAFGLNERAPIYLKQLDNFIKIYISAFLIFRFNPFRDTKFTELDRKIVFSAGVFVLATTTINKILVTYFSKVVDEVNEKKQERLNKNRLNNLNQLRTSYYYTDKTGTI